MDVKKKPVEVLVVLLKFSEARVSNEKTTKQKKCNYHQLHLTHKTLLKIAGTLVPRATTPTKTNDLQQFQL